MKVIPVLEQAEVPIDLSELVRDGVLLVRREAKSFLQWTSLKPRDDDADYVPMEQTLRVTGCVGILPLNERYALAVQPKAPAAINVMLKSLGRLDGVMRVSPVTRRYSTTADSSAEMLDYLVGEFLQRADEIVREGMHRTYARREEVSSHPRGRIRMSETMRLAASGQSYRVASEYFERTLQNAPNECIAAAIDWCATWINDYSPSVIDGTEKALRTLDRRRQRERKERLKQLSRLRYHWRHVQRDPTRRFLTDPQVDGRVPMPGNRMAYRTALPLASALLLRRGFSLEADEGELAFQSLLVDTNELFEAYVRTSLATRLAGSGLVVRNGNALREEIHLYTDSAEEDIPVMLREAEIATVMKKPTAPIHPDILVESQDGTSLLVLDAKYKVINGPAGVDDVRQLITYAVNRKVSRIVSIHPMSQSERENGSKPLIVVGRIGDIAVYQYKLALDGADLDEQTARMASAVTALAGTGVSSSG